jgi:hypothetical protein
MRRSILLLLAGVVLVAAPRVFGQGNDNGSVVKWKSLVGVIQPGNVVGSGSGEVPGGGQPWVLLDGNARVNLNTGHVQFVVHGLVLAGGNSIGTNPITPMRGLLVCDTNGSAGAGNSVLVSTELLPVGPQGDLQFEGDVELQDVCRTESDIAFLITSAPTEARPNGAWFAAGIVRTP